MLRHRSLLYGFSPSCQDVKNVGKVVCAWHAKHKQRSYTWNKIQYKHLGSPFAMPRVVFAFLSKRSQLIARNFLPSTASLMPGVERSFFYCSLAIPDNFCLAIRKQHWLATYINAHEHAKVICRSLLLPTWLELSLNCPPNNHM